MMDIFRQFFSSHKMDNMIENEAYWKMCDDIVRASDIEIEHVAGSSHLLYPDFVYPTDYGYLKNTKSSDQDCIDVWVGSSDSMRVCGCIVTVDLLKRDAEVKLLYACTKDEIEAIYNVHNYSSMQKGILILRDI